MNQFLIRVIKGAIIGAIASKTIDVASEALTKVTNNTVSKIKNSEKFQDIKKDFELRKEGIQTVKYEEV